MEKLTGDPTVLARGLMGLIFIGLTASAAFLATTPNQPRAAATPTEILSPTHPPAATSTATNTPRPPLTPSPTITASPVPNPEPAMTIISPTPTLSTQTGSTPQYGYEIIKSYPHDPNAFTQGLFFVDGILYESTGRYGESSLRKVALESGEVLQLYGLLPIYFAEGMTLWEDKLIQLTWQAGTGFVYDKESFELLETFSYPTEGWGITHDGQRLIMSDGSANLYFRDPETFEELGRVEVFDENGPVVRLNELEYIDGEVYANIWQTDRIARIDPETGRVTGWILLAGLLSEEDRLGRPVDVLNGIAHDPAGDRLFVTGKLWPKLFEIKLTEAGD